MNNREVLKSFFRARPAVNKAAFAREIGYTPQYFDMLLHGRRFLSEKTFNKMVPFMELYGFKVNG